MHPSFVMVPQQHDEKSDADDSVLHLLVAVCVGETRTCTFPPASIALH